MTMMLATPTAPTSSATAPRPRNRVLKAPAASAWAVSAADGCDTLTWLGFSGLAWAAIRLSTVVMSMSSPCWDGRGKSLGLAVMPSLAR